MKIIMIKKMLIIAVVILGLLFGINYQFQNKHVVDLNSQYSNCELGDLVGDDVERMVYENFYIDYHTEDFSKSQIKDYAKKCLDDNVKNQYQMDCCVRMKMYPEN